MRHASCACRSRAAEGLAREGWVGHHRRMRPLDAPGRLNVLVLALLLADCTAHIVAPPPEQEAGMAGGGPR
jgi:hypothetical protein